MSRRVTKADPFLLALVPILYYAANQPGQFDVAALGKAAILIPFPHATGDHQLHNARYFTEKGAAELLNDDEVTAETLRVRVEGLLRDGARREAYADKIKSLATPEAAGEIAGRLLEATKEKGRRG